MRTEVKDGRRVTILEKKDIWYCPKCGFNLPAHWKFDRCMKCGTKREKIDG